MALVHSRAVARPSKSYPLDSSLEVVYNSLHKTIIYTMAGYYKLQHKSKNYFLLLPEKVVRALGAKSGDYFYLELLEDGKVQYSHVLPAQTKQFSKLNDKNIEYVADPTANPAVVD